MLDRYIVSPLPEKTGSIAVASFQQQSKERKGMELFRKSAGYRFPDAFVPANVVELGTGHFCERFLDLRNDPGGRTCSQMTHAARSGCRNFAEGSERLMTFYSTAIELLDAARASLCELRDDFNKWLMMRGQAPWPMAGEEAQKEPAMNKTLDLDGKRALRRHGGERGPRAVKDLEDPADRRRAIRAMAPGAGRLDPDGIRKPAGNFFDVFPGQPYTIARPSRTTPRILFV